MCPSSTQLRRVGDVNDDEACARRRDVPTPGEPITFSQHIRPLFRERDRESMTFAFDLWDYDDVAGHSDAILGRLDDGTMPCDSAWPDAQIKLFRDWISAGKPA